jgi:hypothetical protein
MLVRGLSDFGQKELFRVAACSLKLAAGLRPATFPKTQKRPQVRDTAALLQN